MRILHPAPDVLAFYDGRSTVIGDTWQAECLRLGIAS